MENNIINKKLNELDTLKEAANGSVLLEPVQEEQLTNEDKEVEEILLTTINDLEFIKLNASIFTALLGNIDVEVSDNDTKSAAVASRGMTKLRTYAFGWGVVNEVEESEELDALCDLLEADNYRKRRAVWVQHIVCANEDEAEKLLQKVMSGDKDITNGDGDNR